MTQTTRVAGRWSFAGPPYRLHTSRTPDAMDNLASAARLRGVQVALASMELLDDVRDFQERLLQEVNATLAPTLAPTFAATLDEGRKKDKNNEDAIITSVSVVRRGVAREAGRPRRALDECGRACPRSSRRLTLAPVPLTPPFVARTEQHFR